MTCCVRRGYSFVAFAAVALAFVPAQLPAQTGTGAHAHSHAETAGAIAARWGVDAADVRVEPVRNGEWPADVREVRLLGSGADGTWVVAYATHAGPGSMVVRAGVETELRVAARDLARGTVLAASDITTRRDVRWGPPANEDVRIAAGWIARRRITAGEAFDGTMVELPPAVVPGQDVQIVWSSPAVSLSLAGRAAGRAAIGERVTVRAQTGLRLEGIVIADGVVRVGPEGRTP